MMTHTVELTPVELQHLLVLLADNKRDGWYLGRRDQYWVRAEKIMEKLKAAELK